MASTQKAEKSDGADVVFLRPLVDIPDPNIPLLAAGQKVYREWCETLLKSGLLTLKSREYVEMLAISTDDIAEGIRKGKRPSRQAMEAKRAAMMKLEKLDANATIAAPGTSQSPYAAFGFAKRARTARQGQN